MAAAPGSRNSSTRSNCTVPCGTWELAHMYPKMYPSPWIAMAGPGCLAGSNNLIVEAPAISLASSKVQVQVGTVGTLVLAMKGLPSILLLVCSRRNPFRFCLQMCLLLLYPLGAVFSSSM